jgi:hypothetical protein
VLGEVADNDAGAASGALLTGTQAANALGVAVAGTAFTLLLGTRPGTGHPGIAAYRAAFTGTLLILLGLAATTAALLAVLGPLRDPGGSR